MNKALPARTLLPALLLLLTTFAALGAQNKTSLTEFAGVYSYRGKATVAIVPKNGSLVAILDEAIYPLKWIEGDEFRNGGGDKVIFRRADNGAIDGLSEKEDFFARLAATVPAELVALATVRPASQTDYVYASPAEGDGFKTARARAVGLDEGVLQGLIRDIISEKYPRVDGVLIWRKGFLVLEEYFYGYGVDRPHQLRSATKSIISTLTGIAIDQRKVRDDKQAILELLPWPRSSVKNLDARKARITIGDLLSMRSGLDADDRNSASLGNDMRVYEQDDWARYSIDLPMIAEPGTEAHYASANPYLLSRLIEHAVGQDLFAFAEKNLFQPLGFKNHRWPHQTLRGNEHTFAQIYLRPRDMLKFGLLYLRGGEWNGKQLVPREWIERSTQRLTKIGSKEYGFFWWHQSFTVETGEGKQTINTLLATGNGGQKIFVVPSLDLVAVFTGGNYNSRTDTAPNEIMPRVILPSLVRGG